MRNQMTARNSQNNSAAARQCPACNRAAAMLSPVVDVIAKSVVHRCRYCNHRKDVPFVSSASDIVKQT